MASFRSRTARAATTVCTTLVAAACTSSPTDPAHSAGTVTAVARAPRIAITNGTDEPVFTFTIGENAVAVSNWYWCVDAVRCPPIAPRATAEAAYPTAYNGKPEQTAIVYWYHAVRGSDGTLQPDVIRAIRVGL